VTLPDNALQELREALHMNVVQVQFIKADGTLRVMQATLQEQHLPVSLTEPTNKPSPSHVCRVWDMEKQAWRSFKWDQVQSWQILH
jgi:hypothetical protein